MMNDRFSVNLRRHLLETANERPADGQFAAIVDLVADTPQHGRFAARLAGLPGRIGPLPSTTLRWALLAAALLVAITALALLGGGGPSPSPAAGPGFEGRWTAPDPADGSILTLIVGEGMAPVVQFQDDLARGSGCAADSVKVFRADGVGEINGKRLVVTYPDGGGCGLTLVPIGGRYDYQAGTDTLLDQDDVTWTRVPIGGDPLPTLRLAASPQPGQTLIGECVDLAQGGTYTASAGPLLVTATVPGTPAIPWQGWRDAFSLSGSCGEVAAIAFVVSSATSVNDGGCMPSSSEITDFADAIARLDTPHGDDISDRTDLTIDGHPAARYDISSLSTCAGFGLWSGTIIGRGETGSTYVIDVDGVLLEIELNRDGSQTAAELEEAHRIIESLQFAAGGAGN
jgi:hypothetical protein